MKRTTRQAPFSRASTAAERVVIKRSYAEIAASMESFTQSCERINSPAVQREYDQKWVAAWEGVIVGCRDDLNELAADLEVLSIPLSNTQIQFVPRPAWH